VVTFSVKVYALGVVSKDFEALFTSVVFEGDDGQHTRSEEEFRGQLVCWDILPSGVPGIKQATRAIHRYEDHGLNM